MAKGRKTVEIVVGERAREQGGSGARAAGRAAEGLEDCGQVGPGGFGENRNPLDDGTNLSVQSAIGGGIQDAPDDTAMHDTGRIDMDSAGLADLLAYEDSDEDETPPDGGTDPSVQPVTGGGQQGAPAEGSGHSTGAVWSTGPMETGEERRKRFREEVAAEKKRREEQAAEVARASLDAMADEWEDHYGISDRRGQGVGWGAFDAVAECRPASRHGRNYSERKEWTDGVEERWEKDLEQAREDAASAGETLRLYKATWQGQDLARDDVVEAIGSALQPIGEVDVGLAQLSDV